MLALRISSFLLGLVAPVILQAQVSNNFKHHVVVLMDRSGSVDRSNSEYTIRRLITNQLKRVCFETGIVDSKYLSSNRPLLQQGDYLTVLSFGFEKDSPDVNKFIEKIRFQNRKSLTYNTSFDNTIFKDLWSYINNYKYSGYQYFFNKNWTGLSFAGPHALDQLSGSSVPKDINRTFVIVLTDGEFNGLGDPNNEMKYLGYNEDRTKTTIRNFSKILPRYNKIKEAFLWDRVYEYDSDRRRPSSYKFEVLEYKPLQKTFAIEAIVPFEFDLFFSRTPNDEYVKQLEVRPYAGDNFKIERMNLVLQDTSQNLDIWEENFHQLYNDTTLRLTIADRFINENLSIRAKFWVHFNDGAYGTHLLHPDGDNLQGRKGLNRRFPVILEPHERILFGLIPLPEFMYKLSAGFLGSLQHRSVIFWNITILVMITFSIYFIIKIRLVEK